MKEIDPDPGEKLFCCFFIFGFFWDIFLSALVIDFETLLTKALMFFSIEDKDYIVH